MQPDLFAPPLSVPAIVWPSSNRYGIPDIDINKQARWVMPPVLVWGSVPRTTKNPGTWFFYTEDYRYTALWNNPRPVIESSALVVAEPNFSCYSDMPLAVGLWRIYQKRWLAKYWQSLGVDILVDLNVAAKFYRYNLLGVPVGWRAYATRGYIKRLDSTYKEYGVACNHAQSTDILFVVYGGSRKLEAICQKEGWLWIPERSDIQKGKALEYGKR